MSRLADKAMTDDKTTTTEIALKSNKKPRRTTTKTIKLHVMTWAEAYIEPTPAALQSVRAKVKR
jgi:hypothetical protein